VRAASIEFRVLGPVEAARQGESVALGGPRQRALLALLLLEPGRPVPADRLVEELWHGQAPPGAAGTLHSYVSRLRKALGDDATIASSESGYNLDVPPDQVDARRFERLIDDGRQALARGAAERARERLSSGLALWRGRPFGELGDEGALRLEAERLEEVRLKAVHDRIEAELQLGGGERLVEELEVLVKEHPYREDFWRQLMLALYRAHRQADALDAYRRARELLDAELGLEPTGELRDLERAILRQEVPPVQRAEDRHNLPAPVSSFVGREAELESIERLLREVRLLTLTGVGGGGKTRLALEAARRALPDFPGGVFFVDLSVVTDPGLVAPRVAASLGVREEVDRELAGLIAARLRDAEALIVLDNCEHLREASARSADDLLAAAPWARVLATSREPLGAPGETNYPVPPLGLPAGDAAADEVRSGEAVRLFLERVRAVRPRLGSDAKAVAAAARICVDLDGLPLAIELAAARAKALSLDEIAARLDDRFRFLVSWRRLSAARHRTLLETMDWSYELLSAEEQALLSGLSVFAGGFTLDAVAAVCASGDDVAALEALERLVDASLVVAEERDDGMRFRLLETVRQHAFQRCSDAAAADVAVRHSEYYLELAERAIAEVEVDGNLTSLALLGCEDANLRAALGQFERTNGTEAVLRMCAALWRYWWLRGEIAEGRRLIGAALAASAEAVAPIRVEALRGASTLALRQADYESATALARESVALAQRLDDPHVTSRARMALANAVGSLGDYEEADRLYRESAAGFREAGRGWELANALLNMSDLALHLGDIESVEQLANESLALCRASGDDAGIAVNLGNLAFASLERGDPARARDLLVEGVERSKRLDFREWVATMVEGLAAAAAASGAATDAARLLGASARLQEEIGTSFGTYEARLHERTVKAVREILGEESFAAEWTAGRELSVEDAVALVTTT